MNFIQGNLSNAFINIKMVEGNSYSIKKALIKKQFQKVKLYKIKDHNRPYPGIPRSVYKKFIITLNCFCSYIGR